MNLHSLQRTPGSRRNKLRVGRGNGSGKGKTCGRGHKGQMARSGHKHKLGFEGGQMPLARRLPKRGFTNRNNLFYRPVNLINLEQFEEGSEVTVEKLRKVGLVNGRCDGIKILGFGELQKKLIVKVNAFSSSARTKIEAAGGTCEIVK